MHTIRLRKEKMFNMKKNVKTVQNWSTHKQKFPPLQKAYLCFCQYCKTNWAVEFKEESI